MIVDAHHHLWKPSRGDYHWLRADDPVLARDYLPEDFRPVLKNAGIDRTVLVQAAETEAETAFLLTMAQETDFVAGVVGWLDFDAPDFAAKLDRLAHIPKFVGLRPMLQDHPDDGFILRPQVMENLKHLAASGLALDLLTHPRHLTHAAKALSEVPDLRAAVDHLSKPPIASGQMDGWSDALSGLAENPNVFCKISGLVTEADHRSWSPDQFRPFIEHTLAAFGPERIMFGSDWPVCLLAASYFEVLNAARTILDPRLTPSERDGFCGGNAIGFYGL